MRALKFAVPIALLMIAGCRVFSERKVDAEIASASRDSATGVLTGAEELDLGPPDADRAILFVHGFIGATSNFNDLPMRMAEEGWRVRAMRLPGHGTTPREFETTTAEELIEAVRAELKRLKESHEIVGVANHSMGGALSTLVVADEGADFLVLGAPYYGVTHKWFYVLPIEVWTKTMRPFVRWVYKGPEYIRVKCPEARDKILSYEWVPTRGARTLVELGERARADDVLARVTCPVLWLHSEEDAAASYDRAAEAYAGLGTTDKRHVNLGSSDHHIYWDCDHEEVMSEIMAFADLHSRDAAPQANSDAGAI